MATNKLEPVIDDDVYKLMFEGEPITRGDVVGSVVEANSSAVVSIKTKWRKSCNVINVDCKKHIKNIKNKYGEIINISVGQRETNMYTLCKDEMESIGQYFKDANILFVEFKGNTIPSLRKWYKFEGDNFMEKTEHLYVIEEENSDKIMTSLQQEINITPS